MSVALHTTRLLCFSDACPRHDAAREPPGRDPPWRSCSDPVRADALRLRGRLFEEARRLGAGHLLAYLESHEDEFVAAYVTTRGGF